MGGEFEPWLINILACPVDRKPVRVSGSGLLCDGCGRSYPVREGIPLMIPGYWETEHKF